MEGWQPTLPEMVAATIFVLSEQAVPSDALYIFGSPGDKDLDRRMLARASVLYKRGIVPNVVVHGATIEEVSREFNLTGYGYEFLKAELMKNGVPAKDILAIQASSHTAGEARNLLHMACERGWRTITIMSYPSHQLRCFLQIIALMMEETGVWLRIYNQSFRLHDGDLLRSIKRPVRRGVNILGMKDMDAPLCDHVAGECERTVTYAQDPEAAGKQYTRSGSIPEMLRYLAKRNAMNKNEAPS